MLDAAFPPAQDLHTNNPTSQLHHGARFLRLAEVRRRVPYGRASIYRLIAAGQFPRPYNLGARAVAWLETDIDAWIHARIEKQNAAGRQSQ
jgi:prophage regulatory protein